MIVLNLINPERYVRINRHSNDSFNNKRAAQICRMELTVKREQNCNRDLVQIF